MVTSIQKLITSKRFSKTPEEKIIPVLQEYFPHLKKENLHFHQGVLRFINISSALRMELIFKKQVLINRIKKQGITINNIS